MTYKMYYVKLLRGKVWETGRNHPPAASVRLPVNSRPPVRLACLALLQFPAPGAAQAPPAAPVTIEYLANEGVLVSGHATRILIDGLMGDGLPGYPVVTGATRDSLERALGRFGEITVILVTHVHRDHFSARSVASHLRANPHAVVVGASQVADSLALLASWTDRSRVRVVPARPSSTARMRVGRVAVEAHAIPHPPSRNQPVEHVVWVVELDGRRVLHLGDSSPTTSEMSAAAGAGVDLLLAPFWVLGGVEGLERIAATRAGQIAAFHFGHDSRRFVGSREITPLRAAGQVLELERASPP